MRGFIISVTTNGGGDCASGLAPPDTSEPHDQSRAAIADQGDLPTGLHHGRSGTHRAGDADQSTETQGVVLGVRGAS